MRYAMVIDTRSCIGCQSCTVACKVHNNLPVDMIYNPVTTVGPTGVYPNLHMAHIPLLCMHCENAPCVNACPTGASQRRDDGIVWVDESKCVGCKSCVMACPYGARVSNHEKGTVQKCDFCFDRVDKGNVPRCVQSCHQKARIFGDLEDETSDVFKLVNGEHAVRLLDELGTEPYVFYIYGLEGQIR
ncbi:4Fe-4S dicluster domain-containing protein [Desulfosporosinus fructosivorans]|uniref:4Fe-4S dicluster domain-containing protein n=1 Tax=Desulfosporosinus fructosivorans TaxID=2018669 RepID=A0A4Z0RCL6_9FIRM|nr:4Fe-4S dicluster domain-containing protein [Desulfosporosinus fructosivorans]TGE39927.1 4Fe-4S dicluster domain-containing protein [Desulfosporosinus fructosivorans]